MKNFKFDTDGIMRSIMLEAIEVQKKAVREQYPEIVDFDITYDSSAQKFQYKGLTFEQIKTLPGITENS